MKEATHQRIQGIHVLRYPDNSCYIPVAERVRLVHHTGTPLSVERGEIFHIQRVWWYRAVITVGEHSYIGDAEIHFGAPLDTPDGTNPVSCGQTSAIGNALTFAGFGDLRTLRERLGDQEGEDEELGEGNLDTPFQMIQGIAIVLLDGSPYVPVAERLHHLHLTGSAFTLESCTIHEHNGVWIYQATARINGKRYVGDAEIFFDADPQSIDGRYPISCAQTSAVGSVLALAGFGDVHSLLERQGKCLDEDRALTPQLASADAVLRAKRSTAARAARQGKPSRIDQRNGSATFHTTAASREGVPSHKPTRITPTQLERLRLLCERLGESEPATINELTETEAEQLIARLRTQEEELFQTLDNALQEEPTASESHAETHTVASYAEIGALKTAWMNAYHVKGETAAVRQQWQQFKQRVCQQDVSDDTMTRAQYELLVGALVQHQQHAGKAM